ncbi:hypothetical protein J0H33_00720 [bacterium]|nr:hypothetical protein [bacterium]
MVDMILNELIVSTLPVISGLALGVAALQPVAAGGAVTPAEANAVAGTAQTIAVTGSGYSDCAAQDISAFVVFPQRTGTPPPAGSPYRVIVETPEQAERFAVTTARVDEQGAFKAALRLPDITAERWQGYVALSGRCVGPSGFAIVSDIRYVAPTTAAMLSQLQTGLTEADFPAGTSAIVLPSVLIDSVTGTADESGVPSAEILDHISVYADGQRCAILNLVPPGARDAAGDAIVIIGTANQPPSCGKQGAELSFTGGKADDPIDFHAAVMPGLLQPIKLLAYSPESDPSAGPTPAAPVDGSGVAPTSPTNVVWWFAAGGVLLVLTAVLGSLSATRPRS